MNWDIVEGNWEQFKGKVRAKWGKLTNDDLEVLKGKWDQIYGLLHERYGLERDEAERQLDGLVAGGAGKKPPRLH
jgi:uncharacterized protein YjbJ (UPF0337 family)